MVERIAMNNLRNLPVKTVAATEGNVTRADIIGPNGGVIKGTLSRVSPIVKGDLVQLSGNTAKDIAVVQKYSSGVVHGVAVSNPQGIDNVTVSGNAAAVAQMRRVDVAFFGLALIELDVTATQTPGHLFRGAALASSAAPAANGGMIVVRYAESGEKVVLLVGLSGVLGV